MASLAHALTAASSSLLSFDSQDTFVKREVSFVNGKFRTRITAGLVCGQSSLESWGYKMQRRHLLAIDTLVCAKRREDIFSSDWEQRTKADGSIEDDNAHTVMDDTDGVFQRLKEFWQKGTAQNEEFKKKLKRFGLAGLLSYGLFNTCYYLATFLFIWLYVTPSPGGLGFIPAAKRLLRVLAMVWAGSQVTKLLRLGGALALAPLADRGLTWFTNCFSFESRGKAFGVIVASCFGAAMVVFVTMTILWA
ncbi:hypothetical protein O6H91_16G058500 [Diphasiastrum complanatum]|uniref:Uncharacterized protein n=1 Tax=Diphasiastrum complanatum TaxID=34168 RepID=A0ACC2BCL2_DIPCM|nr:hypothetical protein O6H91_16G058500 [Diphasiastrum complanatum]